MHRATNSRCGQSEDKRMKAMPAVRTVRDRVRRRGVWESAERALGKAVRIPLMPITTRVLQRRIRQVSSIDEALDLAYTFSFCGVAFEPWQERSEIAGLLEFVAALDPKTVLEIGTSNGGSLFLFARAAAHDALIVSVDLPDGEFGGGYPRWRGSPYQAFAADGQHIQLLRADSHEPQTLETVRAALGRRQVDVLFIDGDHTYAGVKQDYETYSPLVRDGGVIAFHDIVPPNPDGPKPMEDFDLQSGEVSMLWTEVRASTRQNYEFVDDWASGRFGIGAIMVNRTPAGVEVAR